MTECKPQPVFFPSLKHKKVVADFQGGTLSSDAGGLLLREADRRLGLIEALNGCLVDPRDPAKVIHEQKTLLAQRIFGMALGYEDLNDHDELRKDPLFSLLANQFPDPNQPLASSPTLCRLENRVDRQALVGMSRVLVEQFIASFEKAPQELILDFDATDDLVHGNQENRFFHGYYDGYCFLPLYVFCENRLLVAYLRPSNIDGALHAKAILKLLVTRLRQAWPGVRIVMRADSGFCRWKLMRWCDRNGVFYVLGLPRNEILQRLAKPWQDQAKLEFESSQEKQRDFHELFYGAQSWDRRDC